MLELIRLEIKKHKLTRYIRTAGVILLSILAFFILFFVMGLNEEDEVLKGYADLFSMVDTMTRACFTIFGGALIVRLFINEYKNKTINMLFMYPISRKQLIAAKMFIVFCSVALCIFISDILISLILWAVNGVLHFFPGDLTSDIFLRQLPIFLVYALSGAGISLASLFFGMRKKSSTVTLVSSIVITILTCSNNGGFTLASIIAIPVVLGCLGIFAAYWSVREIEVADIEN